MPFARSISDIEQSIETVPWQHLAHAYHGASDAPEMLRAFLAAGASGRVSEDTVDWLWGSILHQGSVYSATPPVICILVELLAANPTHPNAVHILGAVRALAACHNAFGPHDALVNKSPMAVSATGQPIWETWVNEPVTQDSDEACDDPMYVEAFAVRLSTIRRVIAFALPTVKACLEHPNPDVRLAAVGTLSQAILVDADANGEAVDQLYGVVGSELFQPASWLSAAIAVDAGGRDISPLLSHHDKRIRLAASLADGTMADTRSQNALAEALLDLDWLEAEFPDGMADRPMHLRFHVIDALLRRTKAQLAAQQVLAALRNTIVTRANGYTVDAEWGPILAWAFPERRIVRPIPDSDYARLPASLTDAQRCILQALVDNEAIWEASTANATRAFALVQLEHDREKIAAVLANS